MDTDELNAGDENGMEESNAKRFKINHEHYVLPTTEELYALKNTENLYQSNLLKLQLDELLNELKIPEVKLKRYETLIKELTSALRSLKSVKNAKFTDHELFENKKINMPLKELCKKAFKEGTYTFSPPSNVFPIGSFASGTQINTGSRIACDLAVEMNADLFNERDYLNYKYFIKKSLYAVNLLSQLSSLKKYSHVKYEFTAADYSQSFNPILCLIYDEDDFEIRLHCFVASDSSTFKPARFNANQVNIRKEFYKKNLLPESSELAKLINDEDEITPNYNSHVLADLTLAQNNNFIKKTFGESKSLSDAVKMLKLWLVKRGLNRGSGCLDNFTLSMFVAYLINTRQINTFMSRYQIFRIVILNLSKAEWNKKGITLFRKESEQIGEIKSLDLASFHQYFEIVFVDVSGYLNLTWNMPKSTFAKLKHDARISLDLLNDELTDNFDSLFIKNHYMAVVFDNLIKIDPNMNEQFYLNAIKNDPDRVRQLVDNFNDSYSISSNLILSLIDKALEDRSVLIYAQPVTNLRWSVSSSAVRTLESLQIGIIFNENYDQQLIKGPLSTNPEAAEFRKFWGSKSELRRFKDSSICEAVYFEAKNLAKKRLIYADIIKHILNLHLSIKEENVKFVDRQLNKLLSLPNFIVDNYGTGEERLEDVNLRLDELTKILKNLKDLPLSIIKVNGSSPAFRLAEVFAPLPYYFKYDQTSEKNMRVKKEGKYLPKYPLGPVMVPHLQPLEVCINLESSGQWPDNLKCIKRLKTAFYIKIAQMLRQIYGLQAFAFVNYLDVFYKGFVFRLYVYTMKELLLMKTYANEQGIIMTKESAESFDYEKRMIITPKITSLIQAFEKRYDCYSGVCRLAKRWLSSHFLLEYFEQEAIDLLCAYLFLHPGSYDPPRSYITGFLRFLELMADFDWKNQLLAIDPDNEIKKEQLVDLKVKFQENRASMAPIYIVTPHDFNQTNSTYTREKPTIQNLCRTVLIAKKHLEHLKNCINNFESMDHFKNMFKPEVSYFDIVIDLKPSYCVKAYQQVELAEGAFLPHYRDGDVEQKDKAFPVVDFDPVRLYVNELREAYGDVALFFYDLYGCTQVYVLFKPDALKEKELKINNAKYSIINSNTNKFEFNMEALVDDLRLIGNELVDNVTIKNNKLFQ